jgi:hypothetical protein
MSDVDSSPTVGPWAREKLDALGAYLDFYTKVLKNQGHWVKSTTFVDAWYGQVYEKADLLGTKTEKRRDAGQRLLEWYRTG